MTPPTDLATGDDPGEDRGEAAQPINAADEQQDVEQGGVLSAEIARRFIEAEAALAELQNHITTLAEIQDQQAQSEEALRRTAEAVAPLGDLAAELLSSLKAAVAAAETIFDNDSPRDIRDDISTLSQTLTVGHNAIRYDIAALVQAFETRHDAIAAERDEVRDRIDALNKRIQAMPERIQRKHGFI